MFLPHLSRDLCIVIVGEANVIGRAVTGAR